MSVYQDNYYFQNCPTGQTPFENIPKQIKRSEIGVSMWFKQYNWPQSPILLLSVSLGLSMLRCSAWVRCRSVRDVWRGQLRPARRSSSRRRRTRSGEFKRWARLSQCQDPARPASPPPTRALGRGWLGNLPPWEGAEGRGQRGYNL